MFSAIIFDMDGVIVDSEPAHYSADTALFEKLGINLSFEERKSFLGVSSEEMWDYILKKYPLKFTIKELLEFDIEMRKKFLLAPNTPKVNPGLESLLKRITLAGIPLGVASSSIMAILEPLLKQLKLSHYFKCFATGDLVLHAKPAPDVFLLAAGMLKVDPSACLVIEDSANGITAAKAAGMTCIGYSPFHPTTNLTEADSVIRKFDEITIEFISSICPESLK